MMASTDIGIDLGTSSILVYVKGKGVVLREPSVVAYDRDTDKIVEIGEEARLMLGRTPGNIVAIKPLRHGVISDYTTTEKMLKYFIKKAVGRNLFGRRPCISVCVPSGVTEVEKRAVESATYNAGARDVTIIEEPVAAAIGAGIDIMRPCGNLIVDKALREQAGIEGFDLVVANILADVIIPLSNVVPDLLKKGGIFISSGIIDSKAEEVKAAVEKHFEIVDVVHLNDWVAIVARR